MTGKLPSFFKETIGAMLNLCLTVYFTGCSKAVLFCGSFMFFLSCVCYDFVRVYLYVPCGHLLGKG